MRYFYDLFSEIHVTPQEREHLVFYLAMRRMQKTMDALLKPPTAEHWIDEILAYAPAVSPDSNTRK